MTLGQNRFGGQGSGAYGCGNGDRQGVEKSSGWRGAREGRKGVSGGKHSNYERGKEAKVFKQLKSNVKIIEI